MKHSPEQSKSAHHDTLTHFGWLWPLLDLTPSERFALRNGTLPILTKLQRLRLQGPYTVLALLQLYAKDPHAVFNETVGVPPAILEMHRKLMQIMELRPNLDKPGQAELFIKLQIASAGDLQTLSLLLALRLEGMENIDAMPRPQEYTKTTLKVYAPLANRLGVFWIKSELEDLCLRQDRPDIYYDIKKKVMKKRNQRVRLVEDNQQVLEDMMRQAEVECQVMGRYKHFYSIYNKLKRVEYDFSRIQDLTAFRILTDSVADCYKALSAIHQKWQVVPGRYKDYISSPKANGYQSLHTTVTTDSGEIIEIQLRTVEMHDIAEYGVAAHWQYKESANKHHKENGLYGTLRRHQSSLNGDTHYSVSLENLLNDRVYVFTPKNDVIELPFQATTIDFAYAIHTDIGHHITAAKINGRIVKLDEPLNNGDRVEVVTSARQMPRKEWLGMVRSSRAKSKIRHAIHQLEREQHRLKGWEMLEADAKKMSVNINRLLKDGRLEVECRQRRNQSVEHLICAIGEGTVRPREILSWFVSNETLNEVYEPRQPRRKPTSPNRDEPLLEVSADGINQMLINLAKCCNPSNEDDVMGYVTHGRGLTIHRRDCPSLVRLDNSRKIQVVWRKFAKGQSKLITG